MPDRPSPHGSAQSRVNFEHQRKRARALLNGARARDLDALQRFASAHSTARLRSSVALHDAQLVIARENGFRSWAHLKAHLHTRSSMTPSGTTSLASAANRALECLRPDPLFRDALAGVLAGETGMSLISGMGCSIWPGYSYGRCEPYTAVRTRFFDDATSSVLSDRTITQVVILGAGMDTRAIRCGFPAGATAFEVDRDDVFDRKEPILVGRSARATCQRRVVRADLQSDWSTALLQAGFDEDRPAAILIEGVLQYLTQTIVERLFRELRRITAHGSWIGLDVVSSDTLSAAFMNPKRQRFEDHNLPPYTFALGDPKAFLADYGWEATVTPAGAPAANYGRWPEAYISLATARVVPHVYLIQGRRAA